MQRPILNNVRISLLVGSYPFNLMPMNLILLAQVNYNNYYSHLIIEKCKLIVINRTKENHEKVKRYLGRGKLKDEDSETETEELDEDKIPDNEEKEREKEKYKEKEKRKIDPNNKTELVCVLEKERSFKVENKLVFNI